MLPGLGSSPCLGRVRTPRSSNKSFFHLEIWILKSVFLPWHLLAIWVSNFRVHSHQQLFVTSIFNLVSSFCIIFRGLKYMEEEELMDWGGGFAHSAVFPCLFSFWHLEVDNNQVGWRGTSMEGVRLNAYRRAGIRMQIRGRLLVADLFTDPAFSCSVRGAIVVGDCCCRFTLLFLLCFHSLWFRLVLQFSVLPLGGEGCGSWGVGRQEVERVRNGWRKEGRIY